MRKSTLFILSVITLFSIEYGKANPVNSILHCESTYDMTLSFIYTQEVSFSPEGNIELGKIIKQESNRGSELVKPGYVAAFPVDSRDSIQLAGKPNSIIYVDIVESPHSEKDLYVTVKRKDIKSKPGSGYEYEDPRFLFRATLNGDNYKSLDINYFVEEDLSRSLGLKCQITLGELP